MIRPELVHVSTRADSFEYPNVNNELKCSYQQLKISEEVSIPAISSRYELTSNCKLCGATPPKVMVPRGIKVLLALESKKNLLGTKILTKDPTLPLEQANHMWHPGGNTLNSLI